MHSVAVENGFSVVDLFCGVGGLTHGFVLENFKVIAGVDFDKTCRYAFEKNNKGANFIHRDLSTIDPLEILKLFPDKEKKILVGCAPCQDFSSYNKKSQESRDKWKLLSSFAKIIEKVEPEIVSMENVPRLVSYSNGEVFKNFLKVLEDLKYHVFYQIVNAQDFGVPQKRKRLILFASKLGKIEIIKKTHFSNTYKTVSQAIKHLPPIEDGEICAIDPLHRARKLTDINKRRIKATPIGGSWKDWPEDLKLDCHKKATGESFVSVYGRMLWDDSAPTLTTLCIGLGNGRFGHPEQHRAISLREAALIQSFPENYDFIDESVPFSMVTISRQIGNSVPVELGRVIAKSIKKHIEDIYGNKS